MSKDNLFLKLEISELSSRIKSILKDGSPSFKIWKDIDHFYHSSLLSFEDGHFCMSDLEILPNKDNYYFVSFSHNNLTYYMKCNVTSAKTLSPLGDVFRTERRKDVRIVMHPRFDAYVYFVMDSDEEESDHGNVLSFNKNQNEENSLIKSFQKEISKDIELKGEKILDISYSGLSLICNQEHYNILNSHLSTKANIILKGQSITVDELSLIYEVDYIDLRFESIKMKKVGINFSENEQLSQIIREYDDESLTLSSLDKEFQTFVETE